MSGNRTTHLRFFRPTRTDRLRYHPICRKCTNRTSPECPKHPMHTITLHSRIKFSRLESNQRPFVYQTNALSRLSYVRMLEPLLGIEPRTIDYKSIVIPFNYRGLLHAWRISKSRHLLLERSALPLSYRRVFFQYVKEPKKNPELCSSGSLYIYDDTITSY